MIKKCIGWAWWLLIVAIAIIDGVNHDWVGVGITLAALALLIAFAVDEEIKRKRQRMSPEEVAEWSAKVNEAIRTKLVKEPAKRPDETPMEHHQRTFPDCSICAERLRGK